MGIEAPAAEMALDTQTLATAANGLFVHHFLVALVTQGPDLLIVNLLEELLGHFVQHVLTDILWHQDIHVRVLSSSLIDCCVDQTGLGRVVLNLFLPDSLHCSQLLLP